MVLAGTVGKDHVLIRRLRTLTFGLLTPFYFIRAGSFVSVPALIAAPAVFLILLAAKMTAKLVAVYPVTRVFKSAGKGGDVHDAPHVHRPHLREHLGPLRPFPWDHRYLAIFLSGSHGGGERRRSHVDCQRLLPTSASYGGKAGRRANSGTTAKGDSKILPALRKKVTKTGSEAEPAVKGEGSYDQLNCLSHTMVQNTPRRLIMWPWTWQPGYSAKMIVLSVARPPEPPVAVETGGGARECNGVL